MLYRTLSLEILLVWMLLTDILRKQGSVGDIQELRVTLGQQPTMN